MMSKKSPQLRFEGFTDDWEEHKLGDYIIQYSEKTKQNNQYPVFTSSRNGLFFQKDYYKGNQIASEDNIGYNIVPRGYFTYRHMSDDLVFKFNINDLADYGIVSTLYPVFTTNEQLNSKYLQYQLNEGSEFRRFSLLQKQGGSRTYMYLNKLQNMILNIPKLEEQQKIGSFFQQLDETIALHQRKLDLLKEQKKGYLQKMFPKAGEKIPELRFAGFADDWEERKLGDEVKINGRIGFRGYTQADIVTKETGVLAYSPTNIVNNRLYRKRSDTYITKQKYRESPEIMVKNSDILFVKTGSTLGKSALVQSINYHATVNPQIVIIRSNELDEYFLSVILTSYNILKRINTIKIGGAIPTMTETELKKFPIQVPKSTEQKKIGSFFKQLDNTIALHQRKLDLLKEQKKGFLQKMFV